MKRSEFINAIEELLEEDLGTYDGSEPLEDVGWDSITFMSFITMVDTKLGKTLSPNDVTPCVTVGDLADLVKDKLEN